MQELHLEESYIKLVSAIKRIAGPHSVYTMRLEAVKPQWGGIRVISALGVARGLLADVNNEVLETLPEIIHADMFSDFLEMADHLLETGYKDPAAVIAGSSLEQHLRLLCLKNGIGVEKSPGKAKSADAMNAELIAVYGKLDQKNVLAWLDLRNKAAHGHYSEYTKEQVALMIGAVRDFISRNPA